MKTIFVTQVELAGFINISTRRARDLEGQGVFSREADGKYDLRKCNHDFIQYLRDRIRGTEATTFTDAKIRRELAKAEIAELDAKERKGELVSHAIALSWLINLGVVVRAAFLQMPHRLFPDDRERMDLVKKEVHRVFRILLEHRKDAEKMIRNGTFLKNHH